MTMSLENPFRITGVERIRFAVQDFAEACRYATDWGLVPAAPLDPNGCVFTAVDGSEIEIVACDPTRPDRTPLGGGRSGVCEITWGVADEASIGRLANELRKDRPAERDAQNVLHSRDDLGIGMAFGPARRRSVPFETTKFNAPGHAARVNRRAVRYERATPHEISHVAIGVPHAGEASAFYIERLGFIVSDCYAKRGVFLRCSPRGNHHHLFLLNGQGDGARFNHLAFKVRDVHEVIGGGQAFEHRGWKTFAGPGRHVVSSACFWYFQSPFGGAWEYAADEDIVTEHWETTDFSATAHIFSEWTFGLEKSDGRLRGPISQSVER